MDYPSPQFFFLVLAASEIGLALFKRAGGSAQLADRGSFALLWIVIGAAIYSAITITITQPRFAYAYSDGLHVLGIIVFCLGLGLRWWSIIHLGRFFTVNVAIAKDHRIVDDGPYRFVRHPSYTGALLTFLGLGTMLFNWLAFAVLVLPVFAVFLRRMDIEEKALVAAFGTAYTTYCARTKRLVPFVY